MAKNANVSNFGTFFAIFKISVGNLAGNSAGNLAGNSVGNAAGNSPYLSSSHL